MERKRRAWERQHKNGLSTVPEENQAQPNVLAQAMDLASIHLENSQFNLGALTSGAQIIQHAQPQAPIPIAPAEKENPTPGSQEKEENGATVEKPTLTQGAAAPTLAPTAPAAANADAPLTPGRGKSKLTNSQKKSRFLWWMQSLSDRKQLLTKLMVAASCVFVIMLALTALAIISWWSVYTSPPATQLPPIQRTASLGYNALF